MTGHREYAYYWLTYRHCCAAGNNTVISRLGNSLGEVSRQVNAADRTHYVVVNDQKWLWPPFSSVNVESRRCRTRDVIFFLEEVSSHEMEFGELTWHLYGRNIWIAAASATVFVGGGQCSVIEMATSASASLSSKGE